MKVWIVMEGDYDNDWIVGVFRSREDALACEALRPYAYFHPEEHEVRDTLTLPFVSDADAPTKRGATNAAQS